VTIETVEVEDAQSFGVDPDVISSANRVKMRVVYDAATRQAAQVPAELLLKVARNDVRIGPIYSNETRVYLRLSREVGIETPLCLGGAYDPETERYALVLGDLVAAGARFPNVLEANTEQHVRSLLDALAQLHARYWESPRFVTDLAWVENHVDSPLARFMNFISSHHNTREAQDEQFKRELIQALATSPETLAGRPGRPAAPGHVAADALSRRCAHRQHVRPSRRPRGFLRLAVDSPRSLHARRSLHDHHGVTRRGQTPPRTRVAHLLPRPARCLRRSRRT
jgi:hypothetical protein